MQTLWEVRRVLKIVKEEIRIHLWSGLSRPNGLPLCEELISWLSAPICWVGLSLSNLHLFEWVLVSVAHLRSFVHFPDTTGEKSTTKKMPLSTKQEQSPMVLWGPGILINPQLKFRPPASQAAACAEHGHKGLVLRAALDAGHVRQDVDAVALVHASEGNQDRVQMERQPRVCLVAFPC